ncbi:hypothetical protein SSTU70S_01111 [Stutzerimonas stutzeri]
MGESLEHGEVGTGAVVQHQRLALLIGSLTAAEPVLQARRIGLGVLRAKLCPSLHHPGCFLVTHHEAVGVDQLERVIDGGERIAVYRAQVALVVDQLPATGRLGGRSQAKQARGVVAGGVVHPHGKAHAIDLTAGAVLLLQRVTQREGFTGDGCQLGAVLPRGELGQLVSEMFEQRPGMRGSGRRQGIEVGQPLTGAHRHQRLNRVLRPGGVQMFYLLRIQLPAPLVRVIAAQLRVHFPGEEGHAFARQRSQIHRA